MKSSMASARALIGIIALAALVLPARVDAGCGCSKPPPPRARVRPFVGYPDLKVSIFNDALLAGNTYWVQFTAAADGSIDWSRGRAAARRDFADGQVRTQLRVPVGNVSLGPCTITVWSNNSPIFSLGDDEFTVTGEPVGLHDFNETVVQDGYQAGVGRDGTVYIAVDVSEVNDGTIFTGTANGFPLTFEAGNVAMYNTQGFLMQLLDPTSPGLFRITRGKGKASDTLTYWRHEFRTYKQEHRRVDARRTDDDPDWHADGTPHVDHSKIIVAIAGTLANGMHPKPGATDAFQLAVVSSRSDTPLDSPSATPAN